MKVCKRCAEPKVMHTRPRWWQFRYRCPTLIYVVADGFAEQLREALDAPATDYARKRAMGFTDEQIRQQAGRRAP